MSLRLSYCGEILEVSAKNVAVRGGVSARRLWLVELNPTGGFKGAGLRPMWSRSFLMERPDDFKQASDVGLVEGNGVNDLA